MPEIVIIGLATDGPSNTPIRLETYEAMERAFGGNLRERFTVSVSATSQQLSYQPLHTPQDYIKGVGGGKLYSPYVSGSIEYFGKYGGTGTIDVDFHYTPNLGKQDLVLALKDFKSLGAPLPYAVRLEGAYAGLSTGDWVFQARHAGLKYNNVSVTKSGSSITITGLEPEYPTLTYNESDNQILAQRINRDFSQGICPVTVQQSTSTLSDFASSLTGGSDGSFTSSEIQNLLQTLTLPTEVSHVLVLCPASSALVDEVYDHNTRHGAVPRLFFAATPPYSHGSAHIFATDLASSIPSRTHMLGILLGDVTVELEGVQVSRYGIERAVAAFSKSSPYSFTHLGLDALSFSPEFGEEELSILKQSGIMALNRYIQSGVAVYQAITSSAQYDLIVSDKVSQLWAAVRAETVQYMGETLSVGRKPYIEKAIMDRVAGMKDVLVNSVDVEVLDNYTIPDSPLGAGFTIGLLLQILVEAVVAKEILSIKFSVRTG
jgi:hypothetical protein